MTWSVHDDARVRAWLDGSAPERAPSRILGATFERTRSARPVSARPAWRQPRVAWLLAAVLTVLALGGGAVLVALSRPSDAVIPGALTQPKFLGDYLWSGGFELEVANPPAGVLDAETAASEAIDPVVAPFLGPPDPPIFARLRCTSPGLCGPATMTVSNPPDAGTTDTWSVWIIEYPQEGAYRILGAADGRMIAGWYGDDLQSCSADEIGTEPFCTPESIAQDPGLPSTVRSALAYWGQVVPWIEYVYTSQRDDNGPYWPADGLDPMAIAATLVAEPGNVDAFQGAMACQRAACPDGVVTEPGEERAVVIVVVDDGTRWVIVDAVTGERLATDETPVEP